MAPQNLFSELTRRNVLKVAITYAASAWLLFEIAALSLPSSDSLDSILKVLAVALVCGLVVAIIISWKFEATPEGLKRTEHVPPDAPLPTWSPRKYASYVVVVISIAACLTAYRSLRPKLLSPEPGNPPAPQAGSKSKP
jgi:hypothetical protein